MTDQKVQKFRSNWHFFAFFCNFWSPMQLKSIRLIHLSKELVEDFRFRASVSLQLYPIYREDPKSTKNSLKLSIFAIFCNFCFPIPRKLNSYDSPVERDRWDILVRYQLWALTVTTHHHHTTLLQHKSRHRIATQLNKTYIPTFVIGSTLHPIPGVPPDILPKPYPFRLSPDLVPWTISSADFRAH